MKGILADVNIEGYVDQMMAVVRQEPWQLFWDDLRLQYYHFSDFGLVATTPDSNTIASVPHLRQSHEYAAQVIETFLDFLLRMDELRGTGRLYLP